LPSWGLLKTIVKTLEGFFKGAYELDMSMYESTKVMTEQDLIYSQPEFTHDMYEVYKAMHIWSETEKIPADEIIPRDFYVPRVSRYDTNYATVVELELRNRKTGEISFDYVTLGHDELERKGVLLDTGMAVHEEEYLVEGWEITRVDIAECWEIV